jgi:hypothetical protein
MMNVVNMHAVVEDYQRRTRRLRKTSGERRALALRREEGRLYGQML